jgi:hypothetical protein
MSGKSFRITILILLALSALVFIISSYAVINFDPTYEFFGRVKPITFFQYSGFLTFAFLLEIFKPLIKKIDKRILSIFLIIGFFCILATIFEMFWAFHYWFTRYQLTVLIEGLPNSVEALDNIEYEPSSTPALFEDFIDTYSLNRSAKRNTLWFMMSVYFVYFLDRILNRQILIKTRK